MIQALKKIIALNPQQITLDFNEYWTCYSPDIDTHIEAYRSNMNWISEDSYNHAIASSRMWEVSLNFEHDYNTYAGSELSDVLKHVMNAHNIPIEPDDFSQDLPDLIYEIIGDRIDTSITLINACNESYLVDIDDLVNDNDRIAFEDPNSRFWSVEWYPKTPVGFMASVSLDIENALRALKE